MQSTMLTYTQHININTCAVFSLSHDTREVQLCATAEENAVCVCENENKNEMGVIKCFSHG